MLDVDSLRLAGLGALLLVSGRGATVFVSSNDKAPLKVVEYFVAIGCAVSSDGGKLLFHRVVVGAEGSERTEKGSRGIGLE